MLSQAPSLEMARAVLRGPAAPRVVAIHSLFLGGVLLEGAGQLSPGQGFVLDLSHPALGQVTVNAVVAWCRQLPDRRHPITAFEFHGSWDGLTAVRHQLAGWLGSRVFDGPRFVGYVLQEPSDPASSCFDAATAKVALVIPHEQGFAVRRRGAGPTDALPLARTFPEALKVAFRLALEPSLNVPGPEARPSPAPPVLQGTTDEEIYGMNTVVIKPDTLEVRRDISSGDTSVVSNSEDSRILGGGRFFGPSADRYPHSKVTLGGEVVAYVAQSGADGSFNLFDPEGRKLALLARPDPSGSVQIVLMGDKATDSLQFLDAETFFGALQVTLELDSVPTVSPPLEGFA